MVGGIYTADPESLSLRATMPRFLGMERRDQSLILSMWRDARASKGAARHGRGTSGARYSLFLSFDEGTQVLADAIVARLPKDSATEYESRVAPPGLRTGNQALVARWLLRTARARRLRPTPFALRFPRMPRELYALTRSSQTTGSNPLCLDRDVNLAYDAQHQTRG